MEQEVMQAIRAELESNIDAKYREFHSSLVPGQNCRILGVRIPVSRRIAKATARDHYEVYTEQFNPEVYEELLIRGMMIGYGKLTREEQTAELDRFVPMINSWGICDSSCATCHFMKKDQEYWYGYLQKWLKSSREYEIRFGVVCLLDFFINEAYIDAVLEEMKKIHHDGYYVKMAVAWAVSISFSFLNLFVPSLKKPDVDGNISCNFTFAFPEICHIRYRRKIRFFFRQFQRDPVIGGVNGIFQRLVEGIPFCIAAGEIWKITFVGSLFGFMKNGWISKFHSVSSFFLFFFTEILFYRSTFSQKIQCLKYN